MPVRKGSDSLVARRKLVAPPKVEVPKRKRVLVPSWLAIAHKEEYKDTRELWSEPAENWRPSSITGSCERISVLKVLGYRGEPNKYNLSRIFEMGKCIEWMWQADFRKMGILVDANVRCEKDFPPLVKGEYDARIIGPDGEFIICEFKSMTSELFKDLPAQTLESDENMSNLLHIGNSMLRHRIVGYVSQLQMYLHMTETTEGLLILDNKDNQKWRDYRITKNDEFIVPIIERCTRLEPYRASQVIPACTCAEEKLRKGPCTHKTEEEVSLTVMKKRFK
jgi:hypothetical protein